MPRPNDNTPRGRAPGQRWILWIDAVGGFMVCDSPDIVLGQAAPDAGADVPILADLSRRHAIIRRDGEGYLIQPHGRVLVAGKELTQPTCLGSNEELTLGTTTRVLFRKPHPLSATARLDLLDRGRTRPMVDGVLLMADTCVLGPRTGAHIVCPDWTCDVVLSRNDGHWFCSASEDFSVDGQPCQGREGFLPGQRIEGETFAMTLEVI